MEITELRTAIARSRFLGSNRFPELWALLNSGALWEASSKAVQCHDTLPLSPWWEVLTHRNPNEPVAAGLDVFGDQKDVSFPQIGTIAIQTLTCASLAALSWEDAQTELGRWGQQWSIGATRQNKTAWQQASREFLEQLDRAEPKSASVLLDHPWPTVLRQHLQRHDWPMPLSAAWAWDAICQLWGFSRVVHRCVVPVAAYEKGAGLLVTLALEILEGGVDTETSDVCHDPRDAFLTSPGKTLQSSIASTFQIARNVLPNPASVAARWRVLEGWDSQRSGSVDGGRRLSSCDGPSAGGAALRGWMHALRGWYPDREVIVIAAVDAQTGKLTGLGQNVKEKMQAIVRFNNAATEKHENKDVQLLSPIDTIVVGSMDDAKAALHQLGGTDVRVVLFDSEAGAFVIDQIGNRSPLLVSHA